MKKVENEIDKRNVELSQLSPEMIALHEKEGKYDPTVPDLFDAYRPDAIPTDQTYLSHPDDFCSVRVRVEHMPDGTDVYSAALKLNEVVVNDILIRPEIKVPEFAPWAYERYLRDPKFPNQNKFRNEFMKGVSVDFIIGRELPMVEVEEVQDGEGDAFLEEYGPFLINRSADPAMTSEAIAHALHPFETLKPSEETNEAFVDRMMQDMVAHYAVGSNQVVVGLSGLPGSGKSTIARLLQERVVEVFGEAFRPIVISTDDYHFGKKALEARYGAPYTDWDAAKTYNTKGLAEDLRRLAEGIPLQKRHFDIASEELVDDEIVEPAPFVIVEGTYAGSKDLAPVRHLRYTPPTTLAASLGQDIRRFILEKRANEAFPSSQARLKHLLEVVVPEFLEMEQEAANGRIAHCRPLAQRAFMLDKLATV